MVEYAVFDMYHIFVELIFGHFLLSIVMLAALFGVMCALFRMPWTLTFSIMTAFLFAMFVGWYGSIVGVFIFFFTATFFVYAIWKWFSGMRSGE